MNGTPPGFRRAFTLIELMLVVAILAIVLGMAFPSILSAVRREPMRQAINGLRDAFIAARGSAIIHAKTVSVTFHPREGTFSVEGGSHKALRPGAGTSGKIDDSLMIEMLDVNLLEYREADVARVRFFPNGTCDEFTMVLRSNRNEWRKLTLEPTTGIFTVSQVK